MRLRPLVIGLAFLWISLGGVAFLGSQTLPAPTPGPFDVPGAEEYGPDEFAPWLEDLRRFEIITIGSFPITWMAASLIHDVGRYGTLVFQGDPDASRYAPLFWAPPDKPALTQEETWQVFGGAIILSVGIGVADWLVERALRAPKDPGLDP